ncbi:MAG: hypothetical protein D6698_17630 [Gammaproteobacteria bacterium]|nr:MAG: hypothetical protein D6698_17630 [Gammaproteobacteria bacterium]
MTEQSMPQIPSEINGVTIEFGPEVNRDVHPHVLVMLNHVVRQKISPGQILKRIYISSANDQHQMPSRHAQAKAVDISRINGMKISVYYPSSPVVKEIVDSLQKAFEKSPYHRENFGPAMKQKLGHPHHVPGHADHIHFSVN